MYKNINKSMLSFFLMMSILLFSNLSIAAPEPPGDSEILTNVFRNPTGSGPKLLSDKVLQITPAIKSQNGSIWSK